MALIGRWKFDEGTGTTAYDSSGNGRNATLRGTATWITPGRLPEHRASLSLPGTGSPSDPDDFANVPNDATIQGLTAVTVCGWLFATAVPAAYGGLLVKQKNDVANPGDDDLLLGFAGPTTGWLASVRVGTSTIVGGLLGTSPTFTTGVWFHLAMTYSSADGLRFYYNGTQQYTAAANGPMALGATTKLSIGANPDEVADIGADTAQYVWPGYIADVQLHDTVLAASDVQWAMRPEPTFPARSAGRPAPFKPGNAR